MSPPANKTSAAKGKEKDASASGAVSLVPPKAVEDSALMKAVKDRSADHEPNPSEAGYLTRSLSNSTKIASEAQHGLISQMLKDIIFSNRPDIAAPSKTGSVESAVETAMAAE